MGTKITTARGRQAATALIAGALTVVLAVDPFGMSPLVPQLAADPLGDGSLSRTERVDSVIASLNLDTPVAATELTGSWDPLAGSGDLAALPAELPSADEQVVTLSDESGGGFATISHGLRSTEDPTPTEVDLGGMSVTVAPADPAATPSAVRLRVAGETETTEAGITGVLLDVSDASATQTAADPVVQLTVSYQTFAGLVGGDWASRLRMMWIPDCAPGAVDCRPVLLETINDPVAQTVSATVPVEPGDTSGFASMSRASLASLTSTTAPSAVAGVGGSGGSLAVTAGASGSGGNWAATSLSPSSTWGAGGSTGAFSWSLPVTVPTVPAGPAPELAVSYSSAGSDGRVPSSNNQSGLVGEGFDLTTGYVERSYVPCSQDESSGANNIDRPSGDLCWGTENATLMFKGSAVELVRDATTGLWHAKHDDGSRIEHLSGAWNGGQADEYWKVTTTDGTQYFFGRGQRSASDSMALNSAWTVPVYGNNPGDPCYHASSSGGFADSRCSQVWRWNLEYVVDPSGNSMTYFYNKELNEYVYDLMGNFEGDTASYTSGGRLDRIEYGTRAGNESSSSAPAKVTFTTAPRCITDLADPESFCSAAQTATAANKWPDTPTDLVCNATDPCTSITPAFFDRYRLSKISTATYDGSAYQPVESWQLQQRFVAQGTGIGLEYATGVMLITTGITHIGHAGTSATGDDLTLPPNQFGYSFLVNRVDSDDDGMDALWRPRITNVRTESGASVSVNYRTECTPETKPGTSEAAQAANALLCYPVKWFPHGDGVALVDYFHKYVVETIVEAGAPPVTAGGDELITGSLATETSFSYGGGAAWAKPTGAMVKTPEMTYSEFRGFAEVTTTVGTGAESSSTSSKYFRGMGGELTAGPAGHPVTAVDDVRFQGQVFAAIELNGATKVSESVTVPGYPVTVATDAAGVKASRIPSSTVYGFSYDAAGVLEHRTRTDTTNDANSQVKSIEDLGDLTTTTDDRCTTISYAHESNSSLTDKHLVSLAAATETVSKACGATAVSPNDFISSDTTTYDADGRILRSERLDPTDGEGHVLVREVLEYDVQGRPLRVADALGQVSTVSYQHSGAGLLQSATSTTPDPDGSGPLSGFASSTTFNPLTGVVTSTTDMNGRVTSGTYDALGRLLTVRYPQHQGSATPSVQNAYTLRSNGLNSVVTKTLGADGVTQHVKVTLYDGLLRPFQSQVEGVDAGANHDADAANRGRMVSHIYYDSAGRVARQTGQWWAAGAPQTPVVPVAVPPSQTTFDYDAAGRTIAEIFWVGTASNPANEKWRTTTAYDGATTIQIPPLGGTPQATIADARGHTVELREYLRDPDADADADSVAEVLALPYQSTTYGYDAAGQRTQLLDPAGNVWNYQYDWAGRQISATDPDAGTSTTSYDPLGRVVTHTNGNGDTLAYTYDPLSRATTLRDDSVTGNIRIKWEYDTALDTDGDPVLGQLASSTRYLDGHVYTTSTPRYDDAYRPLASTLALPDIPEFASLGSRSFTTEFTYTANGQVASVALPAITSASGAKALGREIVTTHYDSASMPSWMSGGFGWGSYVAQSRFASDGRPLVTDLGNTYGAIVSYQYEDGTNQLAGIALDREGFDGTDLDLRYSYDAAGNLTAVKDQPTADAVSGTQFQDNQCFGYDGLRRLEVAWTARDANCGVAQSNLQASAIGGTAPYWTEYSYDPLGNRTWMTEHAVGGSSQTLTTAYTHGEGGAGPHQLTGMTESAGAGDVTATSYDYDDAGNRVTQTASGETTSYNWDREGELAGVGDDDYRYDASGNRLVRSDESGVTVYLPFGQEIHIDGQAVTASRSYSFAGKTVATRTGSGLGAVTSLVCGHQGSVVAAVPNTTWTATSVTRVHSDPFGAIRGGSDAGVPGDHRFLGAVRDTGTGLTLLGARYYDETVGQFISVDPILDAGASVGFNAYAYSGNNPVTFSDPSGLIFDDLAGKPKYSGVTTPASSEPAAPPPTSWAAGAQCTDFWCAYSWASSASLQAWGGIGEGLVDLVKSTCPPWTMIEEGVANNWDLFTNWDAYNARKQAESKAMLAWWSDPWGNFWSPIADDWTNNPGHALGGTVVVAASFAVPGGAALKGATAATKLTEVAGAAEGSFARFAVNSAGEATMRLRANNVVLDVGEHAAQRMTERGISIEAAETTLSQTPFSYYHGDTWKTGYYDASSRIFLGSVNGEVTTVITNAPPNYIRNLKAVVP